jgi:hypothetical protein
LDPLAVIGVGATEFKKVFPSDQWDGITDAYMQGLKMAFALTVSTAAAATVVGVCQKWIRLGRHEDTEDKSEEVEVTPAKLDT